MTQFYTITVTFREKADAETHAIELIRNYLRGKGLYEDGFVPFTIHAE